MFRLGNQRVRDFYVNFRCDLSDCVKATKVLGLDFKFQVEVSRFVLGLIQNESLLTCNAFCYSSNRAYF